jgi:hypothetical protein
LVGHTHSHVGGLVSGKKIGETDGLVVGAGVRRISAGAEVTGIGVGRLVGDFVGLFVGRLDGAMVGATGASVLRSCTGAEVTGIRAGRFVEDFDELGLFVGLNSTGAGVSLPVGGDGDG